MKQTFVLEGTGLCSEWTCSHTDENFYFSFKRDLIFLWNYKAFGGLEDPTQGIPCCLLDETFDIIVWFV